jgi:hypothetical protein
MENKQVEASIGKQAALEPPGPGRLWEIATQVPPGTPFGFTWLPTDKEPDQIGPGLSGSYNFPRVFTDEDLLKIARSGTQTQQQWGSSPASGQPTTAEQDAVVAVGLSAEDLQDPVRTWARIEPVLANLLPHPDKAAAYMHLADGLAQNISAAARLYAPTSTPVLDGTVAGFAVMGSGASFMLAMQGDDNWGKALKGAELVANTTDFCATMGIIPDGGASLKIICIALRGANLFHDKYREINNL